MFKKFLAVIVVVILAVIVGIVLVLGYFGFVPGLSHLMGSDKPRDLGVTATAEDLKSAFAKAEVATKELPPGTPDDQSVKYGGSVKIKTAFSQQELTAFLNDCRWKYCPVTDVQLRINADGTVEMSGLARLDHLDGYSRRFSIPADRIRQGLAALKIAPQVIPFYVKGAPSASVGSVSLKLSAVEIGRLPVPADQVRDHGGEVDALVGGVMAQVPGLSVKSADFSGGSLKFDGSYPAVQSFAP